MQVENMKSPSGNDIANQFVITDGAKRIFQSYASTIAVQETGKKTRLGSDWDHSTTTSKYRNQFLGEDKKETERKIKSGEYVIDNTL